jgi:hypothetical protein
MIEVEKLIEVNSVCCYIKGTDILHREDGPAIEWSDGSKEWYINGKLHREDGPAATFPEGNVMWFLNGISFETKEEWFEDLTEEQKVKALYSESFIRG